MEKIKVAQLEIDTDKLIKELEATKKGIKEISDENKELAKTGKDTSEAFIRNEAELKRLRSEYQKQLKTLSSVTNANDELNNALKQEVKTIDGAVANNKELRAIRNQINASTEEGALQIEKINQKINENTAFIKENSSELERNKLNVGNYKEDIKGALNELNPFNEGLSGFLDRAKEAGGAGTLMKNTFTTIATGIGAATKAGLTFIATPIGAAIAAIAVVVGGFIGLIKNATSRSEEAGNKLDQVFGAVKGVANALFNALQPLGEILIDGIVKGFELATTAASKLRQMGAGLLETLGFKGAAEQVRQFDNEINKALEAGAKYAKLQNEYDKAQRQARKTQLEFQKEAEELRQIRDDESLSIQERIKANEDLGAVLQKQLETELQLAQAALDLANARIEQEGKTKEALDQQAEALAEIADIQERITGQESEQLTNRNALIREGRELAKQAAEERVAQAELELELLKEKGRLDKLTLEESEARQKEYAARELAILQQKLDNKLISETEYQLEKVRLENEELERQQANEEKELQRLQEFEERKRALEDELALAKEEDELAKEELRLEQEYEKQIAELERMQLNEEEKTELLALMEEQREIRLAEIREEYAQKEKTAEAARVKALFEQEKKSAEERAGLATKLTSFLTSLLGDSLAAQIAGIAIQAGLDVAKVNSAAAAAAATNLAQATAAAPPPLNIPLIATAVGQNAGIYAQAGVSTTKILAQAGGQALGAALSKITSKTEGFADGGLVDGGVRINRANGDNRLITAKDGEVILNEQQQQALGGAGTFAAIGVPGFSQGGSVGTPNYDGNGIIDYDLLAAKVAEANMSLPAPEVSVQEFETVQKRVRVVENQTTL